jgi:hypothetical protein
VPDWSFLRQATGDAEPSPAAASSNSVWDIIDQYTDTFEDIVLTSGQADNPGGPKPV